jgi:predicted DNA-binding transcriptional regulator AlpA
MISKFDNAPRRVARMPRAVAILGLSRSTILRREQTDPDFPKRIRLSPHCCGWLEHELIAWLETRPLVLRKSQSEAA